MIAAITSLLTGLKVDPSVAMTGEISTGVPYFLLAASRRRSAAHRAGITTVILPMKCRKDLIEVPKEIQDDLTFRFVERLEEVLDITLGKDALKKARKALADANAKKKSDKNDKA